MQAIWSSGSEIPDGNASLYSLRSCWNVLFKELWRIMLERIPCPMLDALSIQHPLDKK